MSALQGWTLWDPSSVTAWEHVPSGIRCRLVLEDSDGRPLAPSGWRPLEDYLPDGQGHALAHLLLSAGDGQVDVECGADGDIAVCRINAVTDARVQAHWVVDGNDTGWQVDAQPREVALAPKGVPLPNDTTVFLHAQRDLARQALPRGHGALATPLEALEATLAANTFTLPDTHELVTLSRHQAEAEGAWRMPNWETFLTALGIAYADPALAAANCRAALRHLAAGDLLGAEATAAGVRADISSPPVAAHAIWKISRLTGDDQLVADAYPILLHWHRWWADTHDGNHNGLLTWADANESGMPGHPLYSEAAIDDATHLLRLVDVGFNSLWLLDAFALMRMALSLNELTTATQLEEEIRGRADQIRVRLWDRHLGCYRSQNWQGLPTDRQSATMLLALSGGIPIREHVGRMLGEHLGQEFSVQHLVPTLGADDAAFGDQQPWRGRVSALLNYLICEGLRHYGEDAWAERITLSGLNLIDASWQKNGGVFENYNAVTGAGDDIAQDPLAPAGLLFSALGIGLLLDIEPWDGLRLGNLQGIEMAVTGLPLQGGFFDVASDAHGLRVRRNGQAWLETDRPAILRNVQVNEREVSLHAKATDGGQLRLKFHGFPAGKAIAVRVNGQAAMVVANTDGMVEHLAELPPAPASGGPGMARVA